jgi:hypothetical protein
MTFRPSQGQKITAHNPRQALLAGFLTHHMKLPAALVSELILYDFGSTSFDMTRHS